MKAIKDEITGTQVRVITSGMLQSKGHQVMGNCLEVDVGS